MPLIDSHCHLDVAAFDGDFQDMLERAQRADVEAFVVPAIDFKGWPGLQAMAMHYPAIKPAYGLHPMFLAEHRQEHLDALPDWLQKPECVAVGECGLDFFVPGLDVEQQEAIFIVHIRLAHALNKPLIIHARKATERVIQLLKIHAPTTGVIHSYSGSLEQARQLVDMGFMLGIGGPITYPRSNRLRAIIQEIPLQFLLLETDAPDQPMQGEQGQRNEPAKLPKVAHAVAEACGLSFETVAAQTADNTRRLFGFSA